MMRFSLELFGPALWEPVPCDGCDAVWRAVLDLLYPWVGDRYWQARSVLERLEAGLHVCGDCL